MKIEKEIVIQASLKSVYEAYADPLLWKQVLEDVKNVNILHDDGCHQEFEMSVQRGEQQEMVRAVRFCFAYSSIEMFQTKPPPLFQSMKGEWQFFPVPEGVLVKAFREFELKPGVEFHSEILGVLLEKNLSSFKKWLEK